MIGHYRTPFGWIEYEINGVSLHRVSWLDTVPNPTREDSVFHEFLNQWFIDPTTICIYTFELNGTDFQRAVWKQLQKIPLGHTKTYKEVAIAIGSPKAQQAVGQACKANPITLLIPCHRVLGKNDRLTGYVGTKLLSTKQRLLEWERHLITMQ